MATERTRLSVRRATTRLATAEAPQPEHDEATPPASARASSALGHSFMNVEVHGPQAKLSAFDGDDALSDDVALGLSGAGQPLDRATRDFMEPRFGHDFSQVRVHTDGAAAESARGLSARAYTVGQDIAFREGAYDPASTAGRHLLAHELTHVVQQSGGGRTAAPAPTQVQRDPEEDGDGPERRSRSSRPRNAPRGTVPIDQSGLDRETIHKIKDAVGAGPRDWVGITPDGHVIVTDGDGNAEDVGHVSDFARSGSENVPKWVWGLIGLAALIALIVLFATGVGEVGLILAGASLVVILAVKAALRAAGRGDGGAMASNSGDGGEDEGNVAA